MKESDVKKEGWSAEDLGDESSYEDTTEIARRVRRGDETAGNPNARDVAGATHKNPKPFGHPTGNGPDDSSDTEAKG
jgi:hypothetical protein